MSTVHSSPLIAARVLPSIKSAFAALAARRGLTESDLLNLMIRAVLNDNIVAESDRSSESHLRFGNRISVRLCRGDSSRLRDRAAARGMRPARYLTALVHSHLRADAPLPAAELNALKQAVVELTALRRQFAQSMAVPSAMALPLSLLTDLATTVESVRHCVRDTVRANLVSWESDDV